MRCPKPISRSPRSSACETQRPASPARSTSSSIFSTREGAPPCSGPDSAPTAADSAAAQSAPVDATTRATNVEALMPCSAAEIQYASIALACTGSASPRQRMRKRSGIVRPRSTSSCGTGGWPTPRADWATNDSAITDARARLSRAWTSEMSISCRKPHSGASIASAACTSTRGSPERTVSTCGSAGGRPGFSRSSTSRPQTCSKGTAPTRLSMSTPR